MRRRMSLRIVIAFSVALALLGGSLTWNQPHALLGPSQLQAQDPEPAGNAGAAAAANNDKASTPTKRPSMLKFTYDALGWYYSLAFLGLSFSLVALLVMNILASRRESICPPQLVEAFEQQLNEKKFQEAYEMAKADESFLGQVLAAGLARLSAGYEKAVGAMSEVGEEENMKLEHRLSYMALIGTLSPMVGLLGTVDGMVRAFTVIANSPTTPKPSELAHGISTALITTLAGLLIAIPALAAFNILKNRVARLTLEVGVVSENLMSRFESPGIKR